MVRKYNELDIQKIIDLGQEVNEKFTKLFNIQELPEKEMIIVYEEDGNVIGFLHVLINVDWLEILNLVVDKEYRGQGIASILLDNLLSDQTIDVSRILLEVRESNIAAINLYKKFNFFIINGREKYYGNENAVIMERGNE